MPLVLTQFMNCHLPWDSCSVTDHKIISSLRLVVKISGRNNGLLAEIDLHSSLLHFQIQIGDLTGSPS